MRRIKVVSEATDLVPVLRAFDSDAKRDLFSLLVDQWITAAQIQEKFGPQGLDALSLFEKAKLVESRWEAVNGKTEKAFHAYYTAFHINTQASVQETAELFAVALMPETQFAQIEQEIAAMVGNEGYSARGVCEKLNIPLVRLRGLLKRSTTLEFRGQIVRKLE